MEDKTSSPPTWHSMGRIVASAAFVLVFLVLALAVLLTRPLEFSPESWQQWPGLRPRMLSDLLAKHELRGMPRREVTRLLGHPKGQDSVHDGSYIYWAGYSGIDDKWLEVRFHGEEVVDVRIYSD